MGEFLQLFGGAYFATEGALWRSLKLLLLKPGALTAQYLAGRRKHHGLPLRLYLALKLGSGRAAMKDGVFFCERLPTWVCRRIQRRVDIDPRRMLGAIDALKDRFLGNLGGAMFVLLPGFALWLKLAYRNRACTASSAG